MKKTNQQIFGELPDDRYFKTVEKASAHFRDIGNYPGSLGYDVDSGGFLALHRGHSPSAFKREIPVCLVLKKLGYAVILEQEPPSQSSADATINGKKFEIKQVSNAKSLKSGIAFQLRSAYKKSKRVLLHIIQSASPEQLRGALFAAIKRYPVDVVWVVYQGNLFCFEKENILKGRYCF